MEFGSVHLHHRHEDGDEEASGSDEMLIMDRNNNINIGGTNLINNHHHTVINSNEMVEACLSQVQIHQPNPTPPPPTATTTSSTTKEGRYRECLRNHAINVMGHALDGCGEFMPGGPQGSVEALKCAACTCHRNFHRKDDTTDHHYHHHQTPSVLYSHSSHHRHHQQSSGGPFSYYRTSAPSGYLHLGPRLLALPSASGGGGGGSQSGGEDEEEEDVSDPVDGGARYNGGSMMMIRNNKKRFRTKFTAEQKERMLVMAEKIGWRIQKCDEDLVQQFCHESDVKRHVFKVWMHNNKHTLSKSTPFTTTTYYQQSSS